MSIGGLFADVFHSWMRPVPVSQNYLEPKYLMVVWIGSCWASTLLLCLLFVKLKRILKACICMLYVACCMLYGAFCACFFLKRKRILKAC